jgi:hypothetical protein
MGLSFTPSLLESPYSPSIDVLVDRFDIASPEMITGLDRPFPIRGWGLSFFLMPQCLFLDRTNPRMHEFQL